MIPLVRHPLHESTRIW
uniref:Uncharacterized protein n=1 Tax=Arundo donax TaxID=35708 RepID=A0A0A9EQT4_ARUDO